MKNNKEQKFKYRANQRFHIIQSEKFEKPTSPVKKKLRPSKLGWLSLFLSILLAAVLVIILAVCINSGQDAPIYIGFIGIIHIIISIIVFRMSYLETKDHEHSTKAPRAGMIISAIVIVSYIIFYLLGIRGV